MATFVVIFSVCVHTFLLGALIWAICVRFQPVSHLVNPDGLLELLKALVIEYMMLGVNPAGLQPDDHDLEGRGNL